MCSFFLFFSVKLFLTNLFTILGKYLSLKQHKSINYFCFFNKMLANCFPASISFLFDHWGIITSLIITIINNFSHIFIKIVISFLEKNNDFIDTFFFYKTLSLLKICSLFNKIQVIQVIQFNKISFSNLWMLSSFFYFI